MTVSRRVLLAAPAFIPRAVLGSQKLNIAGIGVGGVGRSYLAGCETENIAALCDVDDAYAAKTFAKYPGAKTYRDYRVLLEKEKSIDAVIIGTPDHTHARIALTAIALGKHVYCAKPVTRTIAESRQLARAAAASKVATQMSVQSCGSDDSLTTVEWVRAGLAGKIREVHVWSDRPVWPQAVARPAETPAVPSTLDWKGWLGDAPERPFHPLYHPFNWRGWFDFGTGALGDMGCHTLHVIVQALNVTHPRSVSASVSVNMLPAYGTDRDRDWTRSRRAATPETFPSSSVVTWEYPGVRVVWYDGGLKPPRPEALAPGTQLPADGILFVGDKGVLMSGFTGKPKLLGREADAPPKTLPRTANHYQEWIEACKGGKRAACHFGFGTLLTEIALLGCLAQRTGKHLIWDADAGTTGDTVTNSLLGDPVRL